jgi:hypothetical protein
MPRKRTRRQVKLKAGRPGRFTAQEVVVALETTHGIKSLAAVLLKCNRQTITNYIARYQKVRIAYDAATDVILDIAEGNVYRAVSRGNLEESHWLLVKKGQRRGYSPMGSLDPEQAAYLRPGAQVPALPSGEEEPAPFVLEISAETLAGALRRLQDVGVIIDTEYTILPEHGEDGTQ